MNVIAVDDETFALNDLTEVLEECIADTKIIALKMLPSICICFLLLLDQAL